MNTDSETQHMESIEQTQAGQGESVAIKSQQDTSLYHINKLISQIEASAKHRYGNDINISLARSTAYGNEDNLITIMGTQHSKVAQDFTIIKGAVISTEKGFHFGSNRRYTYSTVRFLTYKTQG